MTTETILYALGELTFLVLVLAIVVPLRAMRRDLKRIADRLDEPVEASE